METIKTGYTVQECKEELRKVFQKHQITKEITEEMADPKYINPSYVFVKEGMFQAIDHFLGTLEEYNIDQNLAVKDNIKKIVKSTNFRSFYQMIEFLTRNDIGISPADFFNTSGSFFLKYDLKLAEQAVSIMKREGYDYKSMIVRCKELTVRPYLNLLADFRNILLQNAKIKDQGTIKAVAENVPSLFTKADYRLLPTILKTLSACTYTYINTDKKTKKKSKKTEKLFSPIDKLLLSNGDILSISDPTEIKKLNTFLNENGLNALNIFSKNTSIYKRAKYEIYAPAYQLAISLRCEHDPKQKAAIVQQINEIIEKDPKWLMSISKESVQKGYEEALSLCGGDQNLANAFHMKHPYISTKNEIYRDFNEMVRVLEYIYQDKDRAIQKIFDDPKIEKVISASELESSFKRLEKEKRFAHNRDELVSFVDENIHLINRWDIPQLLDPNNVVLKKKDKKLGRQRKTLNGESTDIKIYHLTQKIATLTVDCNNLTGKQRDFLKQFLIMASQAKKEEIDTLLASYVASNKRLTEKVNNIRKSKELVVSKETDVER